jgi:hypothetical protein
LCEPETNKLSWKKTKVFFNNEDLFIKMSEYWPFGSKEDKYRDYEKLKFIKKNLEDLEEAKVDDYSIALGKLLRFLKLCLECRI